MTNDDHIAQLVPAFQPLVREVLKRASDKGLNLDITAGYRSNEEQAQLYANGRGQYAWNGRTYYSQKPQIVTYAQPGQSYHNTRRAIDVIDVTHKYAINWTTYGEIGESLGLTWGGRWKPLVDSTHLEYHGVAEAPQSTPINLPVMKEAYIEPTLDPERVRQLYREKLGREPENEQVLQNRRLSEFLDGCINELNHRTVIGNTTKLLEIKAILERNI